MYYAEKFGSYYANLKNDDISPKALHKARLALFDFLTVLMVGKKHTVLAPIFKTYLESKKFIEESTALGYNIKTSTENAALAMGIISHGVELDDGQIYSATHPAVAIMPCALAVAEQVNGSLEDLLRSIVIGYDCMLRFAHAINPSHLRRGFHSTSTCGCLGTAAAAASLYNLDEEQMTYAIGIGSLQSAGIQEMLHSNASIKPLQPGKAAYAGVLAAELAKLGAKCPLAVFEGQYGWINAMTDEFDESVLTDGLGRRWEIEYTYTKLYPSCRYAHAPIDIAIELFKEGYNIKNVKDLKLYLYDYAIAEVGTFKIPKQFEDAMYSVAYSIAIALKYGYVRIEEIKTCLEDEEVLLFTDNIEIISDEEMTKKFPDEAGAKLTFHTNGGDFVERSVTMAKADFDNPLTEEECMEKALTILKGNVPEDQIRKLWSIVVESSGNEINTRDIIAQMVAMGA